VASRRAGEKIILEGRVTVNGKPVVELGSRVDPMHDRVLVDGKPVKAKRKLYIALNKPRRFLTTRQAEKEDDRAIVYDLLPKEWNNLFPVGRLDYDSEGLLFMTNDGDFALKLTHPRYAVPKTYIATVEGRVEFEVLQKFLAGVSHEGERLKAQKAHILEASKSKSTIELVLTEGKNREVRRLFETQGFKVMRLVRVMIGKIKLAELPSGKWRTLTEPEIKSLLSTL
jgi:23S rRNA pseudouridine2605 synthase